jgi:4-amino-4-deoxy-L-arabinose transferase-like glycosyltransferase
LSRLASWGAVLLRHPRLLLVLLSLALFLPSMATLPVVDRDEGRFMQASRQMVASGDWVDIRLQEEPRYKKPVGIYWAQSALASLAGGAAAPLWAFRLPSLLAAVLAVLLVHAIGRVFHGPKVALTAAALVAACLVMAGESRLGKTDAALLATILAAQWMLARCYRAGLHGELARPRSTALLFWLAIAAGVLVKGPLGPMVVLLTVAALGMADRRLAWCRPLLHWPSILLALAVAVPWFVAITLRSDGAFWTASVSEDLLAKVAAGQEGHGAPPGTFLVISWLSFWPGSVLLAVTLWALWRHRKEPGQRFALAWLVPTWVVFELVPTKLLHYVLPVFPALALLAAQAWWSGSGAPRRAALAAATALLGIGPLLLLAVAWLTNGGTVSGPLAAEAWPAMLALPCALLFATLAWRALARGDRAASVLWLLPLALATYSGVLGSLSGFAPAWPSDAVYARLKAAEVAGHTCQGHQLYSLGYHEPSLVWLTHGALKRVGPEDLASRLQAGSCAVWVVEDRQLETFAAGVRESGVAVRQLDRVEGFAFGAGRRVALTLLTPVQEPPREQRVQGKDDQP